MSKTDETVTIRVSKETRKLLKNMKDDRELGSTDDVILELVENESKVNILVSKRTFKRLKEIGSNNSFKTVENTLENLMDVFESL